MRKSLVFVLFYIAFFQLKGQDTNKKWAFSFGVNFVDLIEPDQSFLRISKDYVYSNDWNFSNPYSLTFSRYFKKGLSLAISASTNEVDCQICKEIGSKKNVRKTYLSYGVEVRYYVTDLLTTESSWKQKWVPYLSLGFGQTRLASYRSFRNNLRMGWGFQIWFTNSLGVYFESRYKTNKIFDQGLAYLYGSIGHFQHTFGLVFKVGKAKNPDKKTSQKSLTKVSNIPSRTAKKILKPQREVSQKKQALAQNKKQQGSQKKNKVAQNKKQQAPLKKNTVAQNKKQQTPLKKNTVAQNKKQQTPLKKNKVAQNKKQQTPLKKNTVAQNKKQQTSLKKNKVAQNKKQQTPLKKNKVAQNKKQQTPLKKNKVAQNKKQQTPLKKVVKKPSIKKQKQVFRRLYNKRLKTLSNAVNFDYKRYKLTQEAKKALDKIAVILLKYPDLRFAIQGHTDNIASLIYNILLSFNRASEVKKYLISKGIPEKKLIVRAYGFYHPVSTNKTDKGRSLNRRVEVVLDEITID